MTVQLFGVVTPDNLSSAGARRMRVECCSEKSNNRKIRVAAIEAQNCKD